MQQQSIEINEDGTITVRLSSGGVHALREPLAKDLEGLGQDLVRIKHTDTVQKVIGRISQPPVTRVQYAKLTLSDAQLFNSALDFFSAPPAAKAEMKAALAELGYLSASESDPAA